MRELKKFERGAEKSKFYDGILKLAFFDVDLKNSKLLKSVDSFDEKAFDENFIVSASKFDGAKIISGEMTKEDSYKTKLEEKAEEKPKRKSVIG